MTDKHPTGTRQGEPVAPGARETDREMDPTKRHRDHPEGGAPDMGGDMPRHGTDKDKDKMPDRGTPPTR